MKTQQEISREAIGGPYINRENNSTIAGIQPKNDLKSRANQVSRKDDNAQDLYIGIHDIDSAILYYFNEVIRPRADVNGQNIAVPVVYGSPEKWQAVQKEGFFRDKDGKRQVPIIIFKRDTLERNRNITTKLDANVPNNFYVRASTYTARNGYENFNKIGGDVKPTKALILTTMPDYVKISYSCTIITDYMSQMNPIIEAITYASDSYWGDENRFKFQSFIDSFKTDIKNGDRDDRTIATTFNIKLNGYIIPNSVNSSPNSSRKVYTIQKSDISFEEGTVTRL